MSRLTVNCDSANSNRQALSHYREEIIPIIFYADKMLTPVARIGAGQSRGSPPLLLGHTPLALLAVLFELLIIRVLF